MRCLRGLMCFWLIVSAPLLGMTGFAPGAFLCWGAGGQIGIETESCEPHYCESPYSSSDHQESPGYADCCEDDDSCGACIDIPLPSGGATERLLRSGCGSVLRRVMVCPTHLAGPIATGLEAAEAYFRRRRPGAGDESIASLRTIVLLI